MLSHPLVVSDSREKGRTQRCKPLTLWLGFANLIQCHASIREYDFQNNERYVVLVWQTKCSQPCQPSKTGSSKKYRTIALRDDFCKLSDGDVTAHTLLYYPNCHYTKGVWLPHCTGQEREQAQLTGEYSIFFSGLATYISEIKPTNDGATPTIFILTHLTKLHTQFVTITKVHLWYHLPCLFNIVEGSQSIITFLFMI